MAVPLIVFYLFFIISLFSEIIGKIGVFMRRYMNISIVIPHSSADGDNIIRLISRKPKQSGGGTVVFRQ